MPLPGCACSGTTGRPKGVPLTHANLAASIANIIQAGRGLLVLICWAAWFPAGACSSGPAINQPCGLSSSGLLPWPLDTCASLVLASTAAVGRYRPTLAAIAPHHLTSSHPMSSHPLAQTYEFVPEDRSLLVMPLFHVHGLMAGLLSPLAAGAAVILPAAGRFSAGTFWQDAVQHGATFYTGWAGAGQGGTGGSGAGAGWDGGRRGRGEQGAHLV